MLTRESALFYWDARYGVNPVVGGDPVFSRNSAGWKFDGRLFRKNIVDVPRFEPVEMDGVRRPAMLLEPGLSRNVDNIDAWAGVNHTKDISQPGAVEGQKKYIATTNGGGNPYISRSLGTFNGAKQVFEILMGRPEGVDESHIGLYDVTAGDYRVYATYNWVTGATSQTYLKVTRLSPDLALMRAGWTGVSGNTASGWIRPWGTGSAQPAGWKADIHHVSWSGNMSFPTSPIPGAAGTVRGADSFHWQGAPIAQALARYTRFIRGSIYGAVVANYGSGSVAPRLTLYFTSGGGDIQTVYVNGVGATQARTTSGIPAVLGSDFETVELLAGDGSVRILARSDGGAVADAGWSAAPAGGVTPWSARFATLNSYSDGGGVGRQKYIRQHAVKLADLASALTAPTDLMDELAAYTLGPAGDLVAV